MKTTLDLPDDLLALAAAKHLPDCYLLALAVTRGGKFGIFDQRIDPAWVHGGHHALLLVQPKSG